MPNISNERSVIATGMVLGIGLGGFLDGILAHQIFQLHNMLSAKYPTRTNPNSDFDPQQLVANLEINMFWDGLFHLFAWIMTVIGVILLWKSVRNPNATLSTPTFIGSILLGWGLFNLVEGIVDHHLLHIHHVTETADHLTWDLTFLSLSAVLIVIGIALIRKGGREALLDQAR